MNIYPELTAEENLEWQRLHKDCGKVMLYPSHYLYSEKKDTYTAREDKHEWHEGKNVRRLLELREKIDAAQGGFYEK